MLEETKGVRKTWAEIKTDAKNRVRWRILVEALLPRRNDGIYHRVKKKKRTSDIWNALFLENGLGPGAEIL